MGQLFKNNAKTRLSGDLASDGTTFTVTTGDGGLFPSANGITSDHFLVTFENSSGDKEIARVISRSGDSFTIGYYPSGVPTINGQAGLSRGLDGTTARAFVSGDLVELRLTAGFIEVLQQGSIVFVVDGGGSEISTGLKGFVEAPFSGTIEAVRLFADVTGSIEVDIFKTNYAGYDPSDLTGDSIVDVTPPTISSDFKSENTVLTSWIRAFNAGDIFYFNVNSCSTITKCTISITVDRTFKTSP